MLNISVAMMFGWHTTLVPIAYGTLYMYNLLVIRTARLESVGNDATTIVTLFSLKRDIRRENVIIPY